MPPLNLLCYPDHGEPVPFVIELQDHAITHLISDAQEGYRVYELFMIRRPGDVWQYIWVKVIEGPRSAWKNLDYANSNYFNTPLSKKDWADDRIPLNVFDAVFYAAGDDTPPEATCWLRERHSKQFLALGFKLFDQVLKAQGSLRMSSDRLIKAELEAIDSSQHPLDIKAKYPITATLENYQSIVFGINSVSYYEKLNEIIKLDFIRNISINSDADYRALKAVCDEQRRRSNRSGERLIWELVLHVLTDEHHIFSSWQSKVICWSEGVGYADLFLFDAGDREHLLSKLITHPERLLFSHIDAGPVEGYLYSKGEGWALYEDISGKREYDKHSDRCRKFFAENYFRS